MKIQSNPPVLYTFLPRELAQPKARNHPPQPAYLQQPQGSHTEALARTGVIDYWMTFITVIIFGGISLFGVSSALLKFGHTLTLTSQTPSPLPAYITQQALSQIK